MPNNARGFVENLDKQEIMVRWTMNTYFNSQMENIQETITFIYVSLYPVSNIAQWV